MRDDYLWNGEGEPDPEVERLEKLLSRHAYREPAADAVDWAADLQAASRRRLRLPWIGIAALAAAAAVLGVALLLRPLPPGTGSADAWQAAPLEGTALLSGAPLRGTAPLAVGAWLETAPRSRARLEVAAVGEVRLEPDTRLRLVAARAWEHRLALEHGTIRASTWAPPHLFLVETPSATAIDLGCVYSLQVDREGAGVLRVVSGWVALDAAVGIAYVPAGASCPMRPGAGPGTPFFDDASPAFRQALAERDARATAAALDVLLREARPRDALTLWHLLERLPPPERARTYDRLVALRGSLAAGLREDVLRGDPGALDRLWDALELGRRPWSKTG